jgi:hypothetical protein
MWNTVCSLVSQLMPSTFWPVALVAVPASGGALGTGTPSGPAGPGAGAGLSVPSVLSEASFNPGVPPPALPPPALPPPVAASVMPMAAATTTAPPATASQRRRRRWRASAARACAIFSRACCCLFLLPLDTAPFPWSGHLLVGLGTARPRARAHYLLSTYVDSNMVP